VDTERARERESVKIQSARRARRTPAERGRGLTPDEDSRAASGPRQVFLSLVSPADHGCQLSSPLTFARR